MWRGRALVVHKYGGSPVADVYGIKRAVRRIVATRKSGDQVVSVVSATGDSTDQFMDLADGPGDYCIME